MRNRFLSFHSPSRKKACSNKELGFSLVEISVVLAVLALVLAGIMPFITESMDTDKVKTTMDRLEAIDKALIAHSVQHGRLPCPGTPSAHPLDATFGVPTGNSDDDGDCRDGPVNADWQSDGVAWGAVPVRALDLPDEYALDGWNRKFSYMISDSSLTGLATGSIVVEDIGGNARTNTAVYALVSHGPNGHGAYPLAAGGGRYNAQISSAVGDIYAQAEMENCACDETAASAGDNRTLVMSMKVGSGNNQFDDIVRYKTLPQLVPEESGLLPLTEDLTVTVHQTDTSADYPSINDAVNDLKTTYYPAGGTATIQLLAGFVMSEQLLLENENLGWMTITSVSSPVTIQRSALTLNPSSAYFPAFMALNSATLPRINALFSMDTTGTATDRVGIHLLDNSQAIVGSGSGVTGAASHNLLVNMNSSIEATGGNFSSNRSTHAVWVVRGSKAVLTSANISSAAGDAIRVQQGSTVVADSANLANATGSAIHAVSNANVAANNATANNAGVNCINASHGTVVDAASINCNGAGSTAIFASHNAMINAVTATATGSQQAVYAFQVSSINVQGATLTGATSNCINANGASSITATSANCSNAAVHCLVANESATINANAINCNDAGNISIYALEGSRINAEGATVLRSGSVAARAIYGSDINVHSGNLSNATSSCVEARSASTIEATDVNCFDAGAYCLFANEASTVNATSSTAGAVNCNSSGSVALYAIDGSTISADGVTAVGAGNTAVFAFHNSRIVAKQATLNNAVGSCVVANRNSSIAAFQASCTNAGDRGIVAKNASLVDALGTDTTGSTSWGYFADSGATINAHSGTGSVYVTSGGIVSASAHAGPFSQIPNDRTGAGIIFQDGSPAVHGLTLVSTASQTIAHNTSTTIANMTVQSTLSSSELSAGWNTSTDTFTVPAGYGGWYSVSLTGVFYDTTDGYMAINFNNDFFDTWARDISSGGHNQMLSASTTAYLPDGATVNGIVSHETGASRQLDRARMRIVRLGACTSPTGNC